MNEPENRKLKNWKTSTGVVCGSMKERVWHGKREFKKVLTKV